MARRADDASGFRRDKEAIDNKFAIESTQLLPTDEGKMLCPTIWSLTATDIL